MSLPSAVAKKYSAVTVVRSSSVSRFAPAAVRKFQVDAVWFFDPVSEACRLNFQLPSGFAGGGGTGAGRTAVGTFAAAGAAAAAASPSATGAGFGAGFASTFTDAIRSRATSMRPSAG